MEDDDFDQTLVPDAFGALYAVRGRPTVGRAELQARHDLAETLASQIAAICPALPADDVGAQAEVLGRVLAGLRAEPRQVTEAEALWVVGRVAELQGGAEAAVRAVCDPGGH